MTEEDWLTATRPTGMLLFIREKVSERKVLLFNCACCRRIWAHLDAEDRDAATHAELIADNPAAIREFDANLEPARVASLALVGLRPEPVDEDLATVLRTRTALRLKLGGYRDWGIGSLAFEAARMVPGAEASEELAQVALVHDIFGNPFHPMSVDPRWLTADVVALARGAYDERAFDRLPILADALQDAGCDSTDLLAHCRGPGPHVRGCWVVDRILGKE